MIRNRFYQAIILIVFALSLFYLGGCKGYKGRNKVLRTIVISISLQNSTAKDTLSLDYRSYDKEEPVLGENGSLTFYAFDGTCKCRTIANGVAYFKVLSNDIKQY